MQNMCLSFQIHPLNLKQKNGVAVGKIDLIRTDLFFQNEFYFSRCIPGRNLQGLSRGFLIYRKCDLLIGQFVSLRRSLLNEEVTVPW